MSGPGRDLPLGATLPDRDHVRPWLDSYDSQTPASLDYEAGPFFSLLDRAAREHPGRLAVHFRNWKRSYAQLLALVETMAAGLRAQGVADGDRVAVMLPNLPQTIISFWAALKAGATVVMTNPLYMEKELVHQLKDSGARRLITLDHLWPKIEPLRGALGIETYYVTGIEDCLGFPLNLLYPFKARKNGLFRKVPFVKEPADKSRGAVLPWKTLLSGSTRFSASISDPATTLALLQYTGGTTGVAKGVMLSHANLRANVQQMHAMLHDLGQEPEIFLGLLPYFHVYGLSVCLGLGTAVAATHIPFPRFSPKDTLKAIDALKPTVFPGAPSIYIALMQQKKVQDYDLRSIKFCVSGSAPMPLAAMQRFRELTGAEIIEGYGLTEASPVTHLNPLHGKRKHGSIGLPFPDTDARIVDMVTGVTPLPPGKIGELTLKGPQVMRGYWRRPDDTAGSLRNGWLYTGDIATMDEEGYFFIVDRKKDLILSGGYNVYPREIDEVLLEHPKIREAVAVGIPHHARGEIIKAYVVIEPGQEMTREDILSYCREKLANYKVPKQVEFRDELPKTLVGKILRRSLRAEEEEKAKKRRAGKAAAATPEETTPEPALPLDPRD